MHELFIRWIQKALAVIPVYCELHLLMDLLTDWDERALNRAISLLILRVCVGLGNLIMYCIRG